MGKAENLEWPRITNRGLVLFFVGLVVVWYAISFLKNASLQLQYERWQRRYSSDESITASNLRNEERYRNAIQRGQGIRGYPKDSIVEAGLCGPSAMFATYSDGQFPGGFTAWVDRIRERETATSMFGSDKWAFFGGLRSWGMSSWDLSRSLDLLGVRNSITFYEPVDATFYRTVMELDRGNDVFVQVRAKESFEALLQDETKSLPAGTPIPGREGHWVSVVSVLRDKSGQVDRVGYFDVNVYNGVMAKHISQKPRYVSADVFKYLIRWKLMAPAQPNPGEVFTDRAVIPIWRAPSALAGKLSSSVFLLPA